MMNPETSYGWDYYFFPSKKDDACIYVLGMAQEIEAISEMLESISCNIAYLIVKDWDNDLTPWPAPGLYHGDKDFEGNASETLSDLLEHVIPEIEKAKSISPKRRAIAGYSLAGLFSLYAFTKTDFFDDVASMSGSVWYEGWIDYLQSLKLAKQGSFAYFSLGSKEKHAREKILHAVQDNTDKTTEILKSWGVTVEERIVPGNHFQDIYQRVSDGLNALIKNL